MHLKYCETCGRFLAFKEQTCPMCQQSGNINKDGTYYLSGEKISDESEIVFPPGIILQGRFKIITNLGNSASVYEADDLLRNTKVCLKILLQGPNEKLSDWTKNTGQFNTFFRIADCQHLVRVHDIHNITFDETCFLLQSMEFGTSGTFRGFLNILSQNPIQRTTTGLGFFIQACRGVEVLHENDILHLDIRPENLLFIDGRLKVNDLGMFQYCLSSQDENETPVKDIIHKISSPTYSSPEIFWANHWHEIDKRADIYSLGILLYELTHSSGLPPFTGTKDNLREAHFKIPVPGLSAINAELAEIIQTCLQKNPEDRFESVSQLITALSKQDFQNIQIHRDSSAIAKTIKNEDKTANHDNSEAILEKSQNLYDQNKLNASMDLLERIEQNSSTLLAVKALKKQIRARYEQAGRMYLEIRNLYEEGNLIVLAEIMQEACKIYPDHPDAISVQTELLSMAKCYSEAMEKGRHYLEQERWEDALSSLKQALIIEKKDISTIRTVEVLQKITDLRDDIEVALQCNDLDKAMSLSCLVDLQKEWFCG